MLTELMRLLPPDGIKILLVLFLSFLIGLEREEHRAGTDRYGFGGVRTFPLIGLIGYAMALLSGPQLWPLTVGFAVLGAFLWLSYRHKLETQDGAGITTEVSGLATYLVGALVSRDLFWIATTLTVLSMLLLGLKTFLENLSKRIPAEEILTFTKFLLLTAVILPVLPNENFGPFRFNPYQTWLVVAAVSAVSYGSYILQLWTQRRGQRRHGGIVFSAILGGAYSSTLTTVVMAKRARGENRAHLFSGGILMASGVMYLRLAALVGIFNRELLRLIAVPFLLLAGAALLAGWLWSCRRDPVDRDVEREFVPKNPLELHFAIVFALLFVGLLALTHYALIYFGRGGVFALAAAIGITNVDPFVLSMAQAARGVTPLTLAAGAVVLAAASNNLVKGIYSFGFADRRTGRQSLTLLTVLAILGLAPLLWWR